MLYFPYGPFEVPKRAARDSDKRWKKTFWEAVELVEPKLSTALGVYIFSRRHGTKLTPLYVGKATGAKGFLQEVFTPHKLTKLESFEEKYKGSFVLNLVAKAEVKRGNFCKQSARTQKQVDELESYLIGMALTVHSNIENDKKTSFHRNLEIVNVIGPKAKGPKTPAEKSTQALLGLKR